MKRTLTFTQKKWIYLGLGAVLWWGFVYMISPSGVSVFAWGAGYFALLFLVEGLIGTRVDEFNRRVMDMAPEDMKDQQNHGSALEQPRSE